MTTQTDFEQAGKRAKAKLSTSPHAIGVHYDASDDRVVVALNSRLQVSFSPRDAHGLEHATPAQLAAVEITPSGLGIHFSKLDADLYLPALLEGFLGSKKWMAARLGAAGGQSRTAAKRSAARANGSLGGRPRTKKTSVGPNR